MTARQPKLRSEAVLESAGGTPAPESATEATTQSARGNISSNTHKKIDSHGSVGVAGPPPRTAAQAIAPAAGDFVGLRIWAESYADAQQARIALVNRLERGGVDADLLAGHRQLLDASENAFKLAMVRAYRRLIRSSMPEVEAWQKPMFGIGEHLLARLLGHLGDPIIATPYVWMDDAPEGHTCIEERCGKRHLVALQPFERTLRQLWAYCGHGSPDRRKKGMSQDEALGLGSPRCKMLVHLLAESAIKVPGAKNHTDTEHDPDVHICYCIKCAPPKVPPEAIGVAAGSGPESIPQATATTDPVRDRFFCRRVYDTRKASTADREWTDGHRHTDALRIVGKEILRDLWTAARAQTNNR